MVKESTVYWYYSFP